MARPIRPPAPPKPRQEEPKLRLNLKNKQNRSIFLIMLSLPLIAVSSVVLYKRLYLGQPKRMQAGEYTPDGGLRIFTEEEKMEKDKSSWFVKLFGREH